MVALVQVAQQSAHHDHVPDAAEENDGRPHGRRGEDALPGAAVLTT